MKKGMILMLVLAAIGGLMAWSESAKGSKNMKDTIDIYNTATGTVETMQRLHKTDEEWKKLLTPDQYCVTRLKGTERPFSNTCSLPVGAKSGIYQCVGCSTDLFKHETKFDSGTGWPSFWKPVSELNVRYEEDNTSGMRRTEIQCARCGAHLGHVFDDGPPPTGKRFCINAVALKLVALAPVAKTETATFAAGCFWGVESTFRELLGKGVTSTKVGYTGGHTINPTYSDVCSHSTGHAEAVEVSFDSSKISYAKLLQLFWNIHDPTQHNRQGPDIGSQYRSAIFFHTPEQRKLAEESRAELEKSERFNGKIVTEIVQASEFYLAEEYHQHYYEKKGINPTCRIPSGK